MPEGYDTKDDLFDEIEERDLEKILFSQKPSFVQAMENTLDWFKTEIKKGSRGFKTGFSGIDKALGGGIQTGLHIIGGDSNVGKSAFITQMAFQIAQLNSDVFVLDISLDDALKEKLARVVASHKRIIINAVKDPILYAQQYPGMVKRVNDAVNDLKKYAWHYRTVDDTEYGTDVESIIDAATQLQIELNAMSRPVRLLVFIDNFHDLTTVQPFYNDKDKFTYIVQLLSKAADNLDIPIVCTAELRKTSGLHRPTKEDIREAKKIIYEAKSILMVYNEVGEKGEAASVHFLRTDEPGKQPVLEVKMDKNKYSGMKGRLFFEFYPEMAFFTEAVPKAAQTYTQQVNNSMGV